MANWMAASSFQMTRQMKITVWALTPMQVDLSVKMEVLAVSGPVSSSYIDQDGSAAPAVPGISQRAPHLCRAWHIGRAPAGCRTIGGTEDTIRVPGEIFAANDKAHVGELNSIYQHCSV